MKGSNNSKIKRITEMIMAKAEEKIKNRGDTPLLYIGQYTSVFEAIQEVLRDNIQG